MNIITVFIIPLVIFFNEHITRNIVFVNSYHIRHSNHKILQNSQFNRQQDHQELLNSPAIMENLLINNSNFNEDNKNNNNNNDYGAINNNSNYKSFINFMNKHQYKVEKQPEVHQQWEKQQPLLDLNKKPSEYSEYSLVNCPKCQKQRDIQLLSEDELIKLRIEYVKMQILEKLQLKERPNVLLNSIPKPIADGVTINVDQKDPSLNSIQDDFYAKTTQKIIFPELDREQCRGIHTLGSSMCFTLQIPNDVIYNVIDSAQLWVYKQPHTTGKHSFMVAKVAKWHPQKYEKRFAIHETNETEAGWVTINIAWQMETWIKNNDFNHVIHITCNTCDKHKNLDLFSVDIGLRPFIVVNMHARRHAKRQRRSINCSAGVKDCCREELYVSFSEIGWDDWIIYPNGYQSYFCRGSCSSASSISRTGSHYNTILRKYLYGGINSTTKKGLDVELTSCCSATKFSSLQMLYVDSNNTVAQKSLPNMIAEECGCMA